MKEACTLSVGNYFNFW